MDLDLKQIAQEVDELGRGAHLSQIEDLAAPALELLTPPEQISTTECAARYRLIPDAEGTEASLWSPTLTPYINGIQDSIDDPDVRVVVVPKPGRVGGTIAAENGLFKRLKFGPLTDTLWYLASDSEVDAYVDRSVVPLFNLHPDIQAKVGRSRSDDKRTFKRISGRILEYLQVNRKTITGRTGGFIVGDEIDAITPALRSTFVDQMLIRGTTLGTKFKGYLCSHMDAGWTSGIAAAWLESNRGIWYWPCSLCNGFSSPCPTAPKGWRMRLDYDRPEGASGDELLEIVENTAGLLCPHCQRRLADVHKEAMNAGGAWVFDGQAISREGVIEGEPRSKTITGHWIHGTMSPWVPIGDLAKRYFAALFFFERTKKPERLKEVTAKVLGEVHEGAGDGRAVDAVHLRERAEEQGKIEGFEVGTVPDGVKFVTAAVDVGHRKFDVMIVGWDLEGRSWILERFTITTRRIGSRDVDIRPAERIADWDVLVDQVLERELPLQSDPALRLPIAGVAIDTGDGNVTWKAREFARRMARAGHYWGTHYAPWFKVRPIKGSPLRTAPELPPKGRKVSVDEEGHPVAPVLLEWDIGVHKLKEQVVERLHEEEGGPGQVLFAQGLPRSTFEEFAGEVLIDGTWERRGPNESLDLHAYNEVVRLQLRPERKEIDWELRPPVWARPVPIEAEAPEVRPQSRPEKRKSIFERIEDLNRNIEER